jgi:hypothetical protein
MREDSRVTSAVRPKPEDIDLLNRLIDMRESAELAGIRADPFHLTAFNGGQALVIAPGKSGNAQVPAFGMRRLEDLGALRIISRGNRGGYSFDLADDARDRVDEWRASLGKPSRIGELQGELARAEGAKGAAEKEIAAVKATIEASTAARERRRDDFAVRMGRRVRWVVVAILAVAYLAIYGAAAILASIWASSPLAAGGITVAAGLLALVSWLGHLDGFVLAAKAEAAATDRVRRWLASFEA